MKKASENKDSVFDSTKKYFKNYTTLNLIIFFVLVIIINSLFNTYTIAQAKANESEHKYYRLNGADIYFAGVINDDESIYYMLFIKNWDNVINDYTSKIIFQENNTKDESKIVYNKQGFLIIKKNYKKNYILSKLTLSCENNSIIFYSEEANNIYIKDTKTDKIIIKTLDNLISFENDNIDKINLKIDTLVGKKNSVLEKQKEIKELEGIYKENKNLESSIKTLNNKIIDRKNEVIVIKNYIEILKAQKFFYETKKIIKPKKINLIEKTKDKKKDDKKTDNKQKNIMQQKSNNKGKTGNSSKESIKKSTNGDNTKINTSDTTVNKNNDMKKSGKKNKTSYIRNTKKNNKKKRTKNSNPNNNPKTKTIILTP